jgi:hypothetical protein
VTMVVFSNEVCSTFTAMSSQTLLSEHVHRFCMLINKLTASNSQIIRYNTTETHIIITITNLTGDTTLWIPDSERQFSEPSDVKKQCGYSTLIETQPCRSTELMSCKMTMADMLGSVIHTCFFNIQIWAIYCSNLFFCTEKKIYMD